MTDRQRFFLVGISGHVGTKHQLFVDLFGLKTCDEGKAKKVSGTTWYQGKNTVDARWASGEGTDS